MVGLVRPGLKAGLADYLESQAVVPGRKEGQEQELLQDSEVVAKELPEKVPLKLLNADKDQEQACIFSEIVCFAW